MIPPIFSRGAIDVYQTKVAFIKYCNGNRTDYPFLYH